MPVFVQGFPADDCLTGHVDAVLTAHGSLVNGTRVLDSKDSAYLVKPGFSGAPVFSKDGKEAVGMLTGDPVYFKDGTLRDPNRVAYVIPASQVRNLLDAVPTFSEFIAYTKSRRSKLKDGAAKSVLDENHAVGFFKPKVVTPEDIARQKMCFLTPENIIANLKSNAAERALRRTGLHHGTKLDPTSTSTDTSPPAEDQRLLRVFRLSQRSEQYLRKQFQANGNGLGELLRCVESAVKKTDSELAKTLTSFVPTRNQLIHEEAPNVNVADVDRLLNTLEQQLSKYTDARIPERPTIQLRRKRWIVCAAGNGHCETVTEALLEAQGGDQIWVLPGRS